MAPRGAGGGGRLEEGEQGTRAHGCKEQALGTLCFQPALLPLSCYFKQECPPS